MPDIVAGRQPVVEALKSGRSINRILLARNAVRHEAIAELLRLARGRGVPVEYVDRAVLDKTAATSVHQGVLAYAAAKEYVSLDDLLAVSHKKEEAPLYCILDGLEDPHNLGAIIRSAEASGVHGLIIRARREVGLTAVVAKASAGAIEYVPVARVPNISRAIEQLKKEGIWAVGIDAAGTVAYYKVDFRLPTAVVIGSEGKGISDLVRRKCDLLAAIPMRGKISSLNASVAAALVMYEAFRQRSR